MFAKVLITLLKTTLVLGVVVLLDDMLADSLPNALYSLLPAWVWLLPLKAPHETPA